MEQRGPPRIPSLPCHLSSPLLLLQDLPSLGHPFASSRPLHTLVIARNHRPEGEKRRLTRVPSPDPSPLPSAPDITRLPGSTPAVTSCFAPAHVAHHYRPRPSATSESCREKKVSGSQPSEGAGTGAGGQEQSPKAKDAEPKAKGSVQHLHMLLEARGRLQIAKERALWTRSDVLNVVHICCHKS